MSGTTSSVDERFQAALEMFWHPVCTMSELRSAPAGPAGPLQVRLLGRTLAVAEVTHRDGEPAVIAIDDRCLHRSASLSGGEVDGCGVRCSYHGWLWDGDGRCIDIPAMPDGPIPSRARIGSHRVTVAYDLVWVCLDVRADAPIPACDAFDDPAMHCLPGEPYTWPVGAPRRVENFVDLSHFAFVHAGTLGRRDEPVPPLPDIVRAPGELCFAYDPPDMTVDDAALFGHSEYRMPMPLTVNIRFHLVSGATRVLWMTASPIDAETCRVFWFVCRDDELDDDPPGTLAATDAAHMAFQDVVLLQDEPVVCGQSPRALPLDPGDELSVRTDKVSIHYRRWLTEIAEAAGDPARLRRTLGLVGAPAARAT
jgi:phenylpropionate dioxygenase-like ring-hydroxylating dioxygenase large terminal subunit